MTVPDPPFLHPPTSQHVGFFLTKRRITFSNLFQNGTGCQLSQTVVAKNATS